MYSFMRGKSKSVKQWILYSVLWVFFGRVPFKAIYSPMNAKVHKSSELTPTEGLPNCTAQILLNSVGNVRDMSGENVTGFQAPWWVLQCVFLLRAFEKWERMNWSDEERCTGYEITGSTQRTEDKHCGKPIVPSENTWVSEFCVIVFLKWS